jgi:hypothetical protein
VGGVAGGGASPQRGVPEDRACLRVARKQAAGCRQGGDFPPIYSLHPTPYNYFLLSMYLRRSTTLFE